VPSKTAAAANAQAPTLTRHEQRKSEIADIAAALFAANGYHATSIQDLSDATGLQRGALYHYIDSKKDLLYRIHERFIDPLLAQAREIDARDVPADEAIRSLAHVLLETIHTYRDQVTVFLHEWKTITDDDSWATVRASRREFENIFERVLRRGVKEGLFEISDVRLATLGFVGMINYSHYWLNPEGRLRPDTIADRFVDYFLFGIASKNLRRR